MEDFTIRSATAADAAGAARLVTELGYPTETEQMAGRLAAILADDSYAALIAESQGSVVGLAGGRTGCYFEKDGRYAHLLVLVVASEARGAGVGTALLRAFEQWALARDTNTIVLTSSTHRHEAHAFYQRRGFRQTGVRLVKP
jgi:GNAT superfamily N-acetyltransferase